jgi:Tfp pilus assembly protein PilO
VTVHDVQIASANKPTATDKNADKSDDKNAKLTLQATVKTYRYLDEETKK